MTDREPVHSRPPRGTRRWLANASIALVVTGTQLGVTYASSRWWRAGHAAAEWPVYLLLAIAGLVLIGRRQFPVAVLAVSLAATLAASKLGGGGMIWLALIVAFVNAELTGKRLAAATSLVIGYVSVVWPLWRIGERGYTSTTVALGLAAWLLILLGIAEFVRIRAQRTAALRRSQQEELRRRASEDRMRMARDLHDVVAHNISVINVQANTALHLMDRQPERAKEALTAIHGVSKQALAELRAVLGVLRDGESPAHAPRTPSPGVAQLADLLAGVRAADLDVRLSAEGEPRALPASADIAAYRIIQESLTNVRRHSAATTATVLLRYDDSGLGIEVLDAGPPAAHAAVPVAAARQAPGPVRHGQGGTRQLPGGASVRGGNGIDGMAERVRELGGSFDAGPQAAGGFRVTAWLPAPGSGPGSGGAASAGRAAGAVPASGNEVGADAGGAAASGGHAAGGPA